LLAAAAAVARQPPTLILVVVLVVEVLGLQLAANHLEAAHLPNLQ
jgi:hypothetical protein